MSEVEDTGSDGQKVKPTRLTDAVEKGVERIAER
jgi:hypothetical protein